jgi:membrane-associated phospholipid phosphatase
MSILNINDLALKLVANDFSKTPPAATNGGPTKTSRALAIIHLAAHDAYAKVTERAASPPLPPLVLQLATLPSPPSSVGTDEIAGTSALLGAGIRAAARLYPDQSTFITSEASRIIAAATDPIDPMAFSYGEKVANAWFQSRSGDGSALPQEDQLFDLFPGRHRPDPLNPNQTALGRTWGSVTPFVLTNVATQAPLAAPPNLNSPAYADSFDDVLVNGKNDITLRDPEKATTGIFWGYDGSNKLGTPPRLYNQVVRAVLDSQMPTLSHQEQIRILTAVNAAMADAGIAAWLWKYEYDFWRPVVGIREAEAGWGPSGQGDGNAMRQPGDPFWLPLGAPDSNPRMAPGKNSTPNFPAYPSGHSTFGSAAFMTLAKLLNQAPECISFKFVSDEFNGTTTDNTGATRPRIKETFTLLDAIKDNARSRIYLGVHWSFDADGGETVGNAIADLVFEAFKAPSP